MEKIWDLRKYGDSTAIVNEDKRITYFDLAEATEKISEAIGDRKLIFILCENVPGSVAGYIGCLNAGIVPVLVDAGLDNELLNNLLNLYKPQMIWTPNKELDRFVGFNKTFDIWNYSLLKTNYENFYPLFDDLAVLITTSGSTGSPKLVRQSYDNILSNTGSIIKYLKIDEKERAITNLPMNYVYGLSIINTHLYSGASIVMNEYSLLQKEFWNTFREKEVTSLAGVPYTYEMLNRLNFYNMDLPSLHYITQAGGKLNPVLHEKFAMWAQKSGKRFVVMYGASEATARMGYLPSEKAIDKKGSMGIAIPGGRFELWDADNHVIETPDTVGELVYYGANVTLGYATCGEDLAKGDERNGVLHTGDMAKRDVDGYYYIVGRLKRFLKIYGKRTNLDETEQLLKAHFNDMDIACAGKDDEMKIFILHDGIKDQIVPYLAEKLGINRAAFKVKVIKDIPKNPSGKIMYNKLNEM